MLRNLFNRFSGASDESTDTVEPEILAREDYKGFELQAVPIAEDKTWRVAGAIVPADDADSADKQTFVRADTCASRDDAVDVSLRKARQIVDEQERLGRFPD